VEFLGVLARQQAIANDGILVHLDQATDLAHSTAFVEVGQQRNNFFFRQQRSEQRRAFAFGTTGLAGRTVQHAALLVGAVVIANAQVTEAAFAVVGTFRVLATKPR
jgi:hypothetical protein